MSCNSFSVTETWRLIEFLIENGFKFEFYLNDTFVVCRKMLPIEIVPIVNHIPLKETSDIVCKSIFSINDRTSILLEIKVNTLKKVVNLFPIEAKHSSNEIQNGLIVSELISENSEVKISSLNDIIHEIKAKFVDISNIHERIEANILVKPLKAFLGLIWGCEETFWSSEKITDEGLSSWYRNICELNSVSSIQSKLISIPDSLIDEYFESEIGDSINYNLLSENSKKCLDEIKDLFLIDNYTSLGVVPKFTWSTPTDATWINADKSLCCKTLEDVLLLLKASTKVACDIENAKKKNIRNTLLLREYISAMDEMFEFRVFFGWIERLNEYKIIGISQRNIYNYYEELNTNKDLKRDIVQCIFYYFTGKNAINDLFKIFNAKFIALDIYLIKNEHKFSVMIIDSKPLTETSTLLFDKNDLKIYYLSNKGYDIDFDVLRLVEDKHSVVNGLGECFSGRVPEEFLLPGNLCSDNDCFLWDFL
ncbi:hydrolase [Cryptosporidium bovis]|uniref:hydrolase n=1 Tax=Cryptosporidium bovis TaxID=310047 RepID=UPI00351A61A7|nr:hydrolase [Cryptosporidium bovis]